MTRTFWLDYEHLVTCDVTTSNKTDIYYFYKKIDESDVRNAMERNGFVVLSAESGKIKVDRTKFRFNGSIYHLNQCSDIFEWFSNSKMGEFTYYYDRVVFNSYDSLRFYAAYIEDTTNYITI